MSQIFTDAAAWEKPPTEYTDITEPTAENILPQIPLCTDANFRGCTCLRSALPLARARSAPTEQEDGLTEFIAATFFNNGFNGLIGFDGCVKVCVMLTTDLTD